MPAWPPRAPILCLVSDRLALVGATGSSASPIDTLVRQVAGAVDAGIDLVHVRERDLEAGELRDLVARCVDRAAGSPTRIVVNDRLDVALAAGAHGVHLRGDSCPTTAARGVSPAGFVIGRSVRDAASAATETADYLVLGTVFPTPSKPGAATAGTAQLARASAVARVPVLAIGGVSAERLPELARAGAAGFAAIRLFFGLGVEDAPAWRRRVAAWRLLFDTNRPIS